MSEVKVAEDGKFLKMKACDEKGHDKNEGKGHHDDDKD